MGRHVADPEKGRVYEVQEIQDRHREMVRLSMLGLKRYEIAEHIGVTPQNVSDALRSGIVREHLGGLQDERDQEFVKAQKDLDELLPMAVEAYKSVLNDEEVASPMQKVKVASEVFDRRGLGKTTKVETNAQQMHLSVTDIEEIKKNALQYAKAIGAVVDVSASTAVAEG